MNIIRKIRQIFLQRDIPFYFLEKYLQAKGVAQISILKTIYSGRLTVSKPFKIWGCIRFLIDGSGKINIGKNFHAVSDRRRSYTTLFAPCQLTVIGKGCINIDDSVGLNGTSISAKECVSIGKRVMIAANTIIMDFDGHISWPPDARWSGGGAVEPVIIEDDVWIGMNCVILKGVVIGKGSIIGPNSVVLNSVDPGCLYSGNPAIKIKNYQAES
jgi:acetyltransferase-like isoleucine patch superfamily enzyme